MPFFCSCFLRGAEADTAVFLYINSCTLKTIQWLLNLHLCGLVFSFQVILQSLTKVCSLPKCLFASVLLCFLFPIRAGPTLTGMVHFFFLLLCWRLLCARAFCWKHRILPHACWRSLELLRYCLISWQYQCEAERRSTKVQATAGVSALTCCFPTCRRRDLPGHLPGFYPHGLQRSGQAEPLPAVRSSETLTWPAGSPETRRGGGALQPPTGPQRLCDVRAWNAAFQVKEDLCEEEPSRFCASQPDFHTLMVQCRSVSPVRSECTAPSLVFNVGYMLFFFFFPEWWNSFYNFKPLQQSRTDCFVIFFFLILAFYQDESQSQQHLLPESFRSITADRAFTFFTQSLAAFIVGVYWCWWLFRVQRLFMSAAWF